MAIKGKKRSRGSQGTRRPAAAPRPQIAPRRHTPFYRTRDGIMILSIIGLVAVGLVIWAVMAARNSARELEQQQATLESFTEDLSGALDAAHGPINEMLAVQQVPADEADVRELRKNAQDWVTSLQEVQGGLAQVFPAPEHQEVQQLFNEALALYSSAAETFALLPEAEGDLRTEIFTRASVQRDTATALYQSAIGVLDELRDIRELGSSGLLPPSQPAAQMPGEDTGEGTETIEIPAEGEEGSDGGNGGGGG